MKSGAQSGKHSGRTISKHYFRLQSLHERLYSILIGPLVIVLGLFFLFKFLGTGDLMIHSISPFKILWATGATLGRLFTAYFLSLICAIPLALLATYNSWTEKILLPTFDIIESVPALAFFPVVILFFINVHFINGAAIFILFLSMIWNIVFTVVGGLQIIPKDIGYAAKVFHITGFRYIRQIILPSIFPEIVTGSILALAQGWNLIIVAEVIHTYIPGATSQNDLFGLGSILVNASAIGQTHIFVACISVMIFVIALLNFFVWQRLIHYAQRFKFE